MARRFSNAGGRWNHEGTKEEVRGLLFEIRWEWPEVHTRTGAGHDVHIKPSNHKPPTTTLFVSRAFVVQTLHRTGCPRTVSLARWPNHVRWPSPYISSSLWVTSRM